ncbi:serine hydrolase domain-containing protein [Bacillus sp. FJAT-49736]|uniref:serine hydrolase domain-containing protein n=1 Tax=Bacillus sp. FJAT-49736 TaxID=2833582 RepID=UPI001BC915CD|nr:serine hydrolase domain-containing protein [Bacillus sp. FJAT-49736]MBS4174849.1 beta-lactamase family protein [Bacillus sp. FJAT-49736]
MDWISFEKSVIARMKNEHIPGVAIAVSEYGRTIYEKGFGVLDLDTQEPVTPDTIFGIASVTKSFTALAILILEEEGKLSIDDPVTKYLPHFSVPTIEDIDSVKVHHLLTHTTGLAPLRRREELNKLREHLVYLSDETHEVLGRPGEYFSYCNDTFILLGAIIEKVTGCLFRRYVTEQLLNPLKMYRSTFSIEELSKLDNVSTPYIYSDGTHKKQPWPVLGNYEVGGGIRSTIRDLLKYGEVFREKEVNLISSEQVKKMYTPYIPIEGISYYGYALHITPNYHGSTLVEHGGGQPGVSSCFGFVPEKGLVVAVLSNVSNISAGDIWLEAVNTALGIPLNERNRGEDTVDQTTDEQLAKFVGIYQSKEGSCLEIILENHSLKAVIGNETIPLRVGKNDTLIMKNGKTISFYFKEKKESWAAFFGMRMLLRVK